MTADMHYMLIIAALGEEPASFRGRLVIRQLAGGLNRPEVDNLCEVLREVRSRERAQGVVQGRSEALRARRDDGDELPKSDPDVTDGADEAYDDRRDHPPT